MTPRQIGETMLTGAWLGATQVALGFALMHGVGASALLFFSFVALWISGGAIGAIGLVGSSTQSGNWMLLVALGAATLARAGLWLRPFSLLATLLGLLAGAVVGAFAGHFFRNRARAFGAVRPLFLHENNGFVLGYLFATALLMVSAHLVDGIAAILGVGVLAWRLALPSASDAPALPTADP